jgi:site-specific DNA-methyltransferase (adenine-specific)
MIVKFATEKGDYILDPFAGRGTTGIVATSLGRKFIGVDLYKENVEKSSRNIAKVDSDANLIMGLAPTRPH